MGFFPITTLFKIIQRGRLNLFANWPLRGIFDNTDLDQKLSRFERNKLVLFIVQSIVTVGAAAGGLLGGWMVEKIGRKLSLMFCSLPFVFGFTIIIAAQNVWMLYVGRLLTGLASGVTSLVVPVSSI